MTKKYVSESSKSLYSSPIQHGLDILSSSLYQRIADTLVGDIPPIVISDKYLLSSALQKCIRRGAAVQSIAIAVRLHQIDPSYLKRRLPIIALEDIGLGDALVCHDVLTVCASSKWWGADVNRTIAFLASIMANALKSRAACDAFSLTEVHPERDILLPKLLKCNATDLIDMACNRDLAQIDRLFALRVLGGITVKQNGTYQVLSRCDIRTLDSIASNLELPEVVCWLMARQRKTAGMAAMLPIAFEAGQNTVVCGGREFPRAFDNFAGLPLCTLDTYTRLGKIALKRFYESSDVLKDFGFQHIPHQNAQPLINLAMFQIESSLLDKYLSSPELDDLKEAADEAEMRSLGMVEPTNRKQLYRLLEDGAKLLANIRIEILDKHFLMRPGDKANSPVQLTLKGC